MAKISASDIGKLRKMTGAGMMDCKNALTEAEGDFEHAKELIRERGLAIANKRADRDASEGAVLATTSKDNTTGVVIALNCETDFVAKNEDFVNFANKILQIAITHKPANLDALKQLEMDGKKVEEIIAERSGIAGEKMELSYYEKLDAEMVAYYIHMGNKLATIVGFNKLADNRLGKDVAMQIAAMNPVSVSKDDVPQEVVDKELQIGRTSQKRR